MDINQLLTARRILIKHMREQMSAYTSEIDKLIGDELRNRKAQGAKVPELMAAIGSKNYATYQMYMNAVQFPPAPPLPLNELLIRSVMEPTTNPRPKRGKSKTNTEQYVQPSPHIMIDTLNRTITANAVPWEEWSEQSANLRSSMTPATFTGTAGYDDKGRLIDLDPPRPNNPLAHENRPGALLDLNYLKAL